MTVIQEHEAASGFAALGNPSRLRIFRLLVRAGAAGAPIGVIHRRLRIPLSTLAHHLNMLVKAGLIEQHRNGREVICRANFVRMDGLIAFLRQQCCAGLPETAELDAVAEESGR